MRREWIEIPSNKLLDIIVLSPSMRREWIEITCWIIPLDRLEVSLHAEGVD